VSFALADRVKETSASTGTGTMTLLGPESACQSFVGGIGASVQTYYCIAHRTANEWEVGIGTISASPDSLSRDTVLASSNSGSAVDFSAGTKDVFCTHNAERTAYFDHNNRLIVAHSSGDTLWISHDGTANLFETNAGAFKFTADASLTDATIVVDINAVGTGNGKLRVWDEDTEYLEAYCDGGNGFLEVKSAGGTAGHIFFQYSGNGDVRSFYGTEIIHFSASTATTAQVSSRSSFGFRLLARLPSAPLLVKIFASCRSLQAHTQRRFNRMVMSTRRKTYMSPMISMLAETLKSRRPAQA
jgi:hypothetical protein